MRPLIFLLSAAALLAGCAGPMGGPSRTSLENERLSQECAARGGVMVPSGRPTTGYPAVDSVCRTTEASRIPQ
jgi:hypothetical protein